MKKSVLALILLCLLSLCFPGFVTAKAEVEDNSPSRVINLVFDVSSSMIGNIS